MIVIHFSAEEDLMSAHSLVALSIYFLKYNCRGLENIIHNKNIPSIVDFLIDETTVNIPMGSTTENKLENLYETGSSLNAPGKRSR